MVVRTSDKNDGHVMPGGSRRRSRGHGLGRHGHDRDMLCPWQIGGRIPLIVEPMLPRELLPFDRGLLEWMEVALEETEAKVV